VGAEFLHVERGTPALNYLYFNSNSFFIARKQLWLNPDDNKLGGFLLREGERGKKWVSVLIPSK
jgi:hypothetical protein